MKPPLVTRLAEEPLAAYDTRAAVTTPEDVAPIFAELVDGADRELGLVASLDTRHRLLAVDTVSVGTANLTFLAPREVFRTALHRGAVAIIVAHNHPSGDPTPSGEDERIARRLYGAGQILGIEVLDVLVLGDAEWASLAREGMLV